MSFQITSNKNLLQFGSANVITFLLNNKRTKKKIKKQGKGGRSKKIEICDDFL